MAGAVMFILSPANGGRSERAGSRDVTQRLSTALAAEQVLDSGRALAAPRNLVEPFNTDGVELVRTALHSL